MMIVLVDIGGSLCPLPVFPAAALDASNIYSKNTPFIHLKRFHIPYYTI